MNIVWEDLNDSIIGVILIYRVELRNDCLFFTDLLNSAHKILLAFKQFQLPKLCWFFFFRYVIYMCTYPVILPFCIWWVMLVHGCLQACRCYKKKCCLSCSMKKCCTFTCAIYVSYVATCKCGQTVIRLKIYFYGCMLDFKNWIAKFLYFLNLYFF